MIDKIIQFNTLTSKIILPAAVRVIMTLLLSSTAVMSAEATSNAEPGNTELMASVHVMKQQLVQLQQQVMALTTAGENASFGAIQLSGAVEVEAVSSDDYQGNQSSDIALATVELAVDSALNDWVNIHVLALHEDGDTEPWEIDEGVITIGNTEHNPLYFSAGRMYVPFGNFSSNMVSDPLTLELAETREAAVQISYQQAGVYGSIYAFNGDTTQGADRIEHAGASLGIVSESSWGDYDIGFSYTSNIADSDSIQGYLDATGKLELTDNVPAFGGHGVFSIGDLILIAEYIKAIDEFKVSEIPFNGRGASFTSMNFELGYNFILFARDSTIAVAYQQTQQALSLGLPEDRMLVALSVAVDDSTTLSFEWAHDNDYSMSDAGIDDSGALVTGSGNSAEAVTLQLAVGF